MSFFRKNWYMHLYLTGIYVGKIKIKANEKPIENVYIAHFWFKKQIFKSIHVKSAIHPTKLLYVNEKKKEVHYSFEYETGVEV